MKSFSEYLITENYKNFIGPNSREQREKWADQVWDILQKSYAPVGGIKGSGFSSKQEMIDKIPFWKIFTRGDKVLMAVFYKDKGGRKTVAIATDGSAEAKKIVGDVYNASLKVSYGEKSGPALGLLMKTVDHDVLQNFLMKPEVVAKLTKKDVQSVYDFGPDNLDAVDLRAWNRFPELRPYFYVRQLGNEYHMKVTVGTAGLKI